MKTLDIEGVRRTKRVKTTKPDPDAVRHPDLVNRVFAAEAPNRLWVTDLTFVPTWQGVAYVCFIVDVYDRAIVGWRVASNMKTETVLDAIEMARWSRGKKLPELRCHSDAGAQGGFNRLSQHLDEKGVRRWLPRTGVRRPVICQWRCVVSGVRIGRCVHRCGPQGGRPRRGRCSVSSGR